LKLLKLFILIIFLSSSILQAETVFYFPHYGDGDGLSMSFTFENPSETAARVNVEVYDSNGNTAELRYTGYGSYGNFYTDLAPHGSFTMKTDGSSSPLKVGYVKVQSTNDEVTGVAIFQYAWGGETSILPVNAGEKFVLPFEKNNNMDIGLAICREQLDPVQIKLYDSQGNLEEQVSYDPSGYHSAAFSSEIFGNVTVTDGMLVLESEGDFAPMGLRFGNGVLASLPADYPSEETVETVVVTTPSPVIESWISGTFNGWDGDTVVTLMNGQTWRQAEYHYDYGYAYGPDVVIYDSLIYGWRMWVEGWDDWVRVERIN